MGIEIDLLAKYPKSKRDLSLRLESKTEDVRTIARKFGKEFFDGDRCFGYGGFSYNPRYWSQVVKDFAIFYKLTNYSKILDVGCAKGFMLYDFQKLNKNFELHGVDISKYAITNSIDAVKKNLKVADSQDLPYENNYFDLVISINTIHNLSIKGCSKSLKEIQRVTKKNSFITVDAYRNEEEKERMLAWNLTAKTIMSVPEWIKFFRENKYNGDYYWFIP
jgi:ubiquinone/menaquinone biosynthesis C-methylase UbiE